MAELKKKRLETAACVDLVMFTVLDRRGRRVRSDVTAEVLLGFSYDSLRAGRAPRREARRAAAAAGAPVATLLKATTQCAQ